MTILTEFAISRTPNGVGRKKINDEQTPARFPEGTLDRIDAVLDLKEKRSDFIRLAVERELHRREEWARMLLPPVGLPDKG